MPIIELFTIFKRILVTFIQTIMKKLFLSLLLFTLTMNSQTTVSYTPKNIDIKNPERGLYYPLSTRQTTPSTNCNDINITPPFSTYNYEILACQIDNNLTLPPSTALNQTTISLIQRIIRLDDFKNVVTIPADFLALIATDFQTLRTRGLKCVLRFSYSNYKSPYPTDPPLNVYEPTKEILLGNPLTPNVPGHIAQLKVLTLQYQDVISSIEAGFIGNNGEWDRTTNFGYHSPPVSTLSDAQLDDRKQVGNAIMALCPNRMVAFRTPRFQRLMMGLFPTTLSNPTPTNLLNKPRIAAHNDCFLRNSTDSGTYGTGINDNGSAPQTIEDDKIFLENQSKNTFDGGETCGFDPLHIYDNSINAIAQMKRFHFNYLNSRYFEGIMNSVPPVLSTDTPLGYWADITPNNILNGGGRLEEIKRDLGYRFVLTNSMVSDNTVTINLRNLGFGNVFNERKAYLIMKNTTTNAITKFQLFTYNGNDVRAWNSATATTIAPNISLIKNLTGAICPGTYSLFLELPDFNRPTDSKYSLQLANNNIGAVPFWDDFTGFNNLYQTINITALPIPTITGSTSTCLTDNPITNNSTVLLAGQTATWSITGGSGSITGSNTSPSVNITWTTLPGQITLTVTNAGGCTSTKTQTITSISCDLLSTAYFTQTINNNIVTFQPLNSNSILICGNVNSINYWNFGDGTNSTIYSPTHTYATTGSFNVSMQTKILGQYDQILCSNTYTKTVVVGSGGIRSRFVEETNQELTSIYPNPNNGEFNIEFSSNSLNNIIVDIYDIRGRIIFNKIFEKTNSFSQKLNIGKVSKGIYIISINDGLKKSIKKIVIE